MNKVKLFMAVAAAAICANAHASPISVTGHINREDGDTHYIHYNLGADGVTMASVQWRRGTTKFGPFATHLPGDIHIRADVFVYRWNPNNGGFYELRQTIQSNVTNGSIFFGGPNGNVGPAGQGVFQLQPASGNNAGVTPSPMPTKNQ